MPYRLYSPKLGGGGICGLVKSLCGDSRLLLVGGRRLGCRLIGQLLFGFESVWGHSCSRTGYCKLVCLRLGYKSE